MNQLVYILLRVKNREYLKYVINKIIYISNNLFIISSMQFNNNIYNYLIYNNNVNNNIINMYTDIY